MVSALAFSDESIRTVGDTRIYITSCVIVPSSAIPKTRAFSRTTARNGAPRFHWRNESEETRAEMLATLHRLDLLICAYAHTFTDLGAAERVRGLNLKALVWDLKALGVGELVLEARGGGADKNDRRRIAEYRKWGHADPNLAYRHAPGVSEPILWLADGLAGAVGSSLADDSTHLDRLPGCVVYKLP